jgi:hypothetical protein
MNTQAQSVNATDGIGPIIQSFQSVINGAPYTVSVACVNGSKTYKITGDHRASLSIGLNITGNAGLPTNTQVNQFYYDGTNTCVVAYNAQTFTPSNFTGTTGSYTLSFTAAIVDAEQCVMAGTVYTTAGAAVSFPINSPTFAAPGQGQGWHVGFWDGPGYQGQSGGTLSNINVVDFVAMTFFGAGATGLQRIGYLCGDVQTLAPGAATLATQLGVVIGQMQPNASTIYPLVGGGVNIGLLNASNTAYPASPPFTTIVSGLGTGTVIVASTAGFFPTGSFTACSPQGLTPMVINYTGLTATTFTGCTTASGSATGQTLCWSSIAEFCLPITSFTLPTPQASTVYLNASAGATTATANSGYMAPGAYDGQEVTYFSYANSNAITFSRDSTAGQLVGLTAATVVMGKYSMLRFRWCAPAGGWFQMGALAANTT